MAICNLCSSNRLRVVYTAPNSERNNYKSSYLITDKHLKFPRRIVKCINCGLIFVPPEEYPEELLSNYMKMIDENYLEEENGRRMTARYVLKELGRLKKYGNRLLDLGCCTGFFLDEARKMGWEVYGVELSEWAAQYARERFYLDIYNTTLKKAEFKDNHFDVIIMQDTIEHLVDPKEILIEIRRILKPKGILYINTPDIESLASLFLKARWWGINQFHLYYFSKRTLNKMLKSVGFEAIKWSSYARIFSLKYWIERFKSYNKLICNLLIFISRISKTEKKLIRANLRDQIQVFTKK